MSEHRPIPTIKSRNFLALYSVVINEIKKLRKMITLNHTIVPAQDKEAAAQFFADLFGLEVGRKSPGSPPRTFAVVRVGETNLDFVDMEEFEPHHYAFHVSDEKFDAILGRVKARGMTYAAVIGFLLTLSLFNRYNMKVYAP